MVMETLQIRLTKGLVKRLESLVEMGFYSNRSEAIRDAVRKMVQETFLEEIPKKIKKKEVKHEFLARHYIG